MVVACSSHDLRDQLERRKKYWANMKLAIKDGRLVGVPGDVFISNVRLMHAFPFTTNDDGSIRQNVCSIILTVPRTPKPKKKKKSRTYKPQRRFATRAEIERHATSDTFSRRDLFEMIWTYVREHSSISTATAVMLLRRLETLLGLSHCVVRKNYAPAARPIIRKLCGIVGKDKLVSAERWEYVLEMLKRRKSNAKN